MSRGARRRLAPSVDTFRGTRSFQNSLLRRELSLRRARLSGGGCMPGTLLPSQTDKPPNQPPKATKCPKGPPRFPRGPRPLAGTRLTLNPFLAYYRPYRPWSNAPPMIPMLGLMRSGDHSCFRDPRTCRCSRASNPRRLGCASVAARTCRDRA